MYAHESMLSYILLTEHFRSI